MIQLPTDRILVPIANEDDAEETCDALTRYVSGRSESTPPVVVAVHVVEKAGGYIDKAPLEARQQQAKRVFDIVTDRLERAGFEVETELVYSTNVVDAIYETADTSNASAVVFLPREGGTLVRILSGNLTAKLVSAAEVPVLVLPVPPGSTSSSASEPR